MRIRLILSSLALGLYLVHGPHAMAQADSSAVMTTLHGYLDHVDRLSLAEAAAETDFIIGSVAEGDLRNSVATAVYRHFRDSKYMGSENVAIHIYDNWFANFKALFPSLEDLDEAEFHAFVNRASLIGRKAAEVKFTTDKGDTLAVPSAGRKNRPTIIYFYSTGCPKCLYTSLKIKELLNKGHYKVNVFTIYTGNEDDDWKAYTGRELKLRKSSRTKVWHLMGGDADYVIPYGVIQTPRLFLLDPDGVIIGRGLDADAVKILLENQR